MTMKSASHSCFDTLSNPGISSFSLSVLLRSFAVKEEEEEEEREGRKYFSNGTRSFMARSEEGEDELLRLLEEEAALRYY